MQLNPYIVSVLWSTLSIAASYNTSLLLDLFQANRRPLTNEIHNYSADSLLHPVRAKFNFTWFQNKYSIEVGKKIDSTT